MASVSSLACPTKSEMQTYLIQQPFMHQDMAQKKKKSFENKIMPFYSSSEDIQIEARSISNDI